MHFYYTMYWDAEGNWLPRPAARKIALEGVRPGDCISRFAGQYKTFWEFELLEEIAMRGPRGGVYIDAGANVGTHSVYFGLFLCEQVIAIEPHPRLVAILKRNLRANQVANCCVIPQAIGAEPGTGLLVPAADGFEHDSQRNQLRPLHDRTEACAGVEPVSVTTLDRVMEEIEPGLLGRPIRFLKLDIEGLELAALNGAQRLLAAHKPQLAVEANSPQAHAAVVSFLDRLGYQPIAQFRGTPTFYFVDPSVHRVRSERWSLAAREAHRLEIALREIAEKVPPGEPFILVDEDQWGLGDHVAGRRRLAFPERNGIYWGKPADGAAAVQECERCAHSGARFIVFGWPAFWWLDHYAELNDHLRQRYECVLENDRLIIFRSRSAQTL